MREDLLLRTLLRHTRARFRKLNLQSTQTGEHHVHYVVLDGNLKHRTINRFVELIVSTPFASPLEISIKKRSKNINGSLQIQN